MPPRVAIAPTASVVTAASAPITVPPDSQPLAGTIFGDNPGVLGGDFSISGNCWGCVDIEIEIVGLSSDKIAAFSPLATQDTSLDALQFGTIVNGI